MNRLGVFGLLMVAACLALVVFFVLSVVSP